MQTNIIHGKVISDGIRTELTQKIAAYRAKKFRPPHLDVIVIGDDPASLSYVKGKEKAGKSVGIDIRTFHLRDDVTQDFLNNLLDSCSKNDATDGILLQMPVPEQINEEEALLHIAPEKDVDGLNPVNLGRFYINHPLFTPCTPLGIMEILKKMGCDPDGKHAVVVGRSALVGSPVARLLQNANATVTTCHSHTKNLSAYTRTADILISAVGKPQIFTADDIKTGAYVIDVGISRVDGHLLGDCDTDSMNGKAAAITPVPGGVGPMTITMLLQNTFDAYERWLKKRLLNV